MRFYADENFAVAAIVELRNLGHDVLTAFEDGKANQKIAGDKVLERAAELGRVVLTVNRRDFKKFTKRAAATPGFLSAHSTRILSGRHTELTTLAKIYWK